MANKLALTAALLVALLAALVALATATTYTTTVTTTTFHDGEENPRESQQCRQQVQGRQFQSCQRYLTSRRSGGGREIELLEMTIDNPRQQEQEEEQHLRQCCQQLRNVDEQCRCEAIRHAVRQSQEGGGSYQGEQMQQVYQKARSLPQRCNMRSPKQCEIRAIFL